MEGFIALCVIVALALVGLARRQDRARMERWWREAEKPEGHETNVPVSGRRPRTGETASTGGSASGPWHTPSDTGGGVDRMGTPAPFDPTTAHRVAEPETICGAGWVIDGDTVVIANTQVRLFGVDAPELNHPFGIKAQWALVALCKGQRLRAEIRETDDYGRTVATVFLPDGRDLSAEMVKLGLAIDWAKYSGGVYRCHETDDARKRLWLADARQKGRMHVWERFEERRGN